MKLLILLTILLTTLVTSISGQSSSDKESDLNIDKTKSKKNKVSKCSENPDPLYNRQKTLEQFAEILNESIPEFKAVWDGGFFIRNRRAGRFGIYDLTDTSNKDDARTKNCVNLINNHIYHVVSNDNSYSFSHIIILEDGKLKVFRSINCKGRADSLDDVLNYLNQKLKETKNKDKITKRVKNYRKYGHYFSSDPMATLQCKAIKN